MSAASELDDTSDGRLYALEWANKPLRHNFPYLESSFNMGRKVRRTARRKKLRPKNTADQPFRHIDKAVFLQRVPPGSFFPLNGPLPVPEGTPEHIQLILDDRYGKKHLKVQELTVKSDEVLSERDGHYLVIRAAFVVV